ncbi:MAG: histidine--tRNA ligase [Candidatus Moranbacteria bacterium]|nr:histidine--tRNA ligase [Candidatus Moranbacteria bacterium]
MISKKKILPQAKKKTSTAKKIEKKVVKKTVAKEMKKAAAPEKESLLMQPPRGMRDILPIDQPYWEKVRKALAVACQEYGYNRIDLPALEFTNLFVRSIGEGTDVIDKEIYSFVTKGGDKVSLRPEMTAGLARAYIQHGMSVLPKPIRLFSMGPLYRYERPQEGRYREHFQANFDVFGEDDPILDAQIIHLAQRVVSQLGLKNIEFRINSIGTAESRREYEKVLIRHLEFQKNKLCQNCRERLVTNPLRILDCKEDKCAQLVQSAPKFAEHLDQESKNHFKRLQEYLDELEVTYVVSPQMVRGLDYYTRTVFEIFSTDGEGRKTALGGGGRYDRLIQSLGGEETPAIGFGLGMDRLVLEMQRNNVKLHQELKPKVFLAQLGDLAKKKSLRLFSELQKNGILVAESFGRGSLKSQMRVANRLNVEVALILGQKEALDETVILKDMVSGTQETVTQDKLVIAVRKILKGNQVVVAKKGE